MSIAVVLPLDASTTVEQYRRSLKTFLAQTMCPRALVVLERGISEDLDVEVSTSAWPLRGHPGVFFFRPVARPDDMTAVYRAGAQVNAEVLTCWEPGEEFHRDTLGHLWVEQNNGCASVVYAEDERIWAACHRQWFELGPVFPTARKIRAALLVHGHLIRRIAPVRDYTPDPGATPRARERSPSTRRSRPRSSPSSPSRLA
ncbi:hypothetical protein K2Z84_05325 [Candidatus Binatia bacterium]|nr:hypothetical protein [Candidatus Binatia bacterium]